MQYLLMGGQACVLYGAAEFSRDTDLTLLASPENLVQLGKALDALQASVIAVPPLALDYLERGHAVHFAYQDPEVELLSLPDLAQSKKTQRDKDWPMLRRLVEANYLAFRDEVTAPRVEFWLLELRTPDLLMEAAARFGGRARELSARRPLLEDALAARAEAISAACRERRPRSERRIERIGRRSGPSSRRCGARHGVAGRRSLAMPLPGGGRRCGGGGRVPGVACP